MSASAPTGASIGLPVAATDADTGDTLTYSLEGRDAASFDINTTTGQLLTKSGVTLINRGNVHGDSRRPTTERTFARITVSIEATADASQQLAGIHGGREHHAERVQECAGWDIHWAACHGD